MAEAKIEFALGGLSFSAEGTEDWLSAQLEKVIAAVPTLGQLQTSTDLPNNTAQEKPTSASETDFTASLASHIKAKGGESNQVKRFLAAADWLRRKDVSPLTTAGVTKALSSNHQKKLSNPADCLNKLVSKGHCEKADDGFFINPDGLKDLGYQ